MDLSKFEGLAQRFDEGRKVEILHPETGKKTGLWVQVVSYQSDRCKKAQRRMANDALREAKRNPKKSATAEEIEGRTLELVIASVVDWNAERDGKPLDCTPENIRDTLSNPDHWFITEQIDREAGDETAFLSGSQKPSAGPSRQQSAKATT